MPIEIKKSQNPVKYEDAISFMEDRLKEIDLKKVDDLIWVLEHDHIYTSGTSYNENDIIGIPGNIKSYENNIEVFTKKGTLSILSLQKENSKVLGVKDFLNSNDLSGKKFN